MQTSFTAEQLRDPETATANQVLRTCVHCGMCTATCPTFVLLGDELDSPRGRIYLMKDMLESGRPATAEVVKHVDRCLSCLSCMTTCPSGVNYMHLVDHGRRYIEETYRRPWHERLLRDVLTRVLPRPGGCGWPWYSPRGWAGRCAPCCPAACWAAGCAPCWTWRRAKLPPRQSVDRRASGRRARGKGRVALLAGCAQQVLAPSINAATIRLLTRHGLRGRGARRRRLLRRADPPHGPARPGDGRRPRQHRRLDRGGGWRRAGRDPGQHLRLRHDGEGLRPHVPQRAGARRRPPACPSPGQADVSEFLFDASTTCRRGTPPGLRPWPTTPPARCSTASRC